MSDLMQHVEVKYIGKREPWFDRLYDTGLHFVCGQSRVLPWDMAPKFLRHSDLFERVQASATPKGSNTPAQGLVKSNTTSEQSKIKDEKPDDTQALIKEQSEKNKDELDRRFELQSLYDQVANMDKDALKHFAEVNYQQKLNKSKSESNLRAEVVSLIDRFGAV